MIIDDFITYLESDGTLTGYLNSAGSFYPNVAPQNVDKAFIVFKHYQQPREDSLDVIRMELKLVDSDKLNVNNIRERIKTLLDKEDEIQGDLISTDYWLHYCSLDSSFTYPDPPDLENPDHIEIMIFIIKYKKKTWF